MQRHRVFIEAPITCEQELHLPEPQSHHLGKVLRMQPGQFVWVFNGSGGCYEAEIIAVEKRRVSVIPREFIADEAADCIRINLAQGISRGRHMDYTIQKAVELGVTRIIPLITDFSNVNLSADRRENKLSHWCSIIISACEQSGRNRIPELTQPMVFDEWITHRPAGAGLFLHPGAGASLTSIAPASAGLTLISGPEGGFSEREIAMAEANGCIAVRLGPRILRTETAAIAAISACQTLWGDMG